MRSDKIIENNKGIISKYNGLRTEKDVAMATLDVLTDISETAAVILDFLSFIYNRPVVFARDEKQEEKQS